MNWLKIAAFAGGGLVIGWVIGYMIAQRRAKAQFTKEIAAQKALYDELLKNSSSQASNTPAPPSPSPTGSGTNTTTNALGLR